MKFLNVNIGFSRIHESSEMEPVVPARGSVPGTAPRAPLPSITSKLTGVGFFATRSTAREMVEERRFSSISAADALFVPTTSLSP